jgi:hypothetical protein
MIGRMTYTEPMDAYRSARGRAIALGVLVVAQLGVHTLATCEWAAAAGALDDNLVAASASFRSAGLLDGVNLLLFFGASIVFMTWVYRSIANLPALGSMSCRFSPASAVWSYFIPLVNFVRGHQVMATIWKESQPPAVNESGFYLPRKTTLVNWWWGAYLFSAVAGMATTRAHPVGVESLHELATGQIVFHVMRMVGALLFLLMIQGAQKRQDEQCQDLERRRNVPQPTADALR